MDMTKQITFIDVSYIKSLIANDMNIPVAQSFARLVAKYELHVTDKIIQELTFQKFGGNAVIKDWFSITGNYILDSAPVTARYEMDLAIEMKAGDPPPKNLGELSLVEAATKYPSVVIFSDDKFFRESIAEQRRQSISSPTNKRLLSQKLRRYSTMFSLKKLPRITSVTRRHF